MISNMPYVGRHYPFEGASFYDGRLDAMYFGELSKLDLIGYAIRPTGMLEDPRIRHFRIKSMDIETDPPMAVMADGNPLGKCPLHLEARDHALGVIVGLVSERKRPGVRKK
jgi:diacylglycerol kinase family enzyme